MEILFTCPPGLEDIVALELTEKAKVEKIEIRPFGIKGRLLAIIDTTIEKLLSMKSVEHILIYLGSFNIKKDSEGLKQIYEKIKDIDFSQYLKKENTFRITSERKGQHNFTSIDIQKVAGQAIVDKYGNKVKLKGFDVEIRVDVIDEKCLVGIALTSKALHRRGYRVFNHPAALNPVIAYGMVRLSKFKENEFLVDPMTGGGTIPIEAAMHVACKAKIVGLDINPKFVEGAKLNAEVAGVGKCINFEVWDCYKLSEKFKEVDKIVTNPPYGIRMGSISYVKRLFARFLEQAYKVLKNEGIFTTLALKKIHPLDLLEKVGFEIIEERNILHGNLNVDLIICRKL